MKTLISSILPVLVFIISGCSGSDPAPDAGCMYDGGTGDAGPCGACRYYYDDKLCGLTPPDAGYYPCQQAGDLTCYDYCTDSSQCKDSARPYCSILGLFNGGDWNCNKSVKVCRAKKDDDCTDGKALVNCYEQWNLIFSETEQAASTLRNCATDKDCVFASPSYDCLGGCGVPLAVKDGDAFRKALVEIADKYCTSEFKAKCGASIDCDTRYAYCSGSTCVAGK